MSDEAKQVDRTTRALAIVGVVISIISASFTGLNAIINYRNAAAASERLMFETTTSSGYSDVFNTSDGPVYEEKSWDVIISNASLSTKITITSLTAGPRSKFIDVTTDYDKENNYLRWTVASYIKGLPELPVALNPSDLLKIVLVTVTLRGTKALGEVTANTSRGNTFKETITSQ